MPPLCPNGMKQEWIKYMKTKSQQSISGGIVPLQVSLQHFSNFMYCYVCARLVTMSHLKIWPFALVKVSILI